MSSPSRGAPSSCITGPASSRRRRGPRDVRSCGSSARPTAGNCWGLTSSCLGDQREMMMFGWRKKSSVDFCGGWEVFFPPWWYKKCLIMMILVMTVEKLSVEMDRNWWIETSDELARQPTRQWANQPAIYRIAIISIHGICFSRI